MAYQLLTDDQKRQKYDRQQQVGVLHLDALAVCEEFSSWRPWRNANPLLNSLQL